MNKKNPILRLYKMVAFVYCIIIPSFSMAKTDIIAGQPPLQHQRSAPQVDFKALLSSKAEEYYKISSRCGAIYARGVTPQNMGAEMAALANWCGSCGTGSPIYNYQTNTYTLRCGLGG